MVDKPGKSISVRIASDQQRRSKAKSRPGSVGDVMAEIDWWHPSLTPVHMKRNIDNVRIIEPEIESDSDQLDVGEKPKQERQPVMAIHEPIDVEKYLRLEDDHDGEIG